MPLSDIPRIVTGLVEMGRQCLEIAIEWNPICERSILSGVEPRLQTRPRWPANWLAGEAFRQVSSRAAVSIKVGAQSEWVPMHSQGIPSLLIRKKNHHIRATRFFRHSICVFLS